MDGWEKGKTSVRYHDNFGYPSEISRGGTHLFAHHDTQEPSQRPGVSYKFGRYQKSGNNKSKQPKSADLTCFITGFSRGPMVSYVFHMMVSYIFP